MIRMTREEYEAKYGQSPSISSTQPTNQGTPIKMTRAEYEAKYGVQEQPQEKGLLRRMGEGLISSEIAAGKMIGTAISSVTQRKNIEETIKRYNETGDKWSEMAKKETDPIKKQLYMKNAQQSYLDGGKVWDEVIGNENLEKGSSVKQVAGAFGGVALDIATAGTYGQAAKLAKTGVRLKSTLKTAIPTVAKEVVASGAKSLAKKSAVGAGIGYGYDVTQSMQAGESLPDILTPGYGTLLGAAIPVGVAGAKLGYQGTKAAIKGVGNVVSKVAQHTADIPDGMVVDYLAKTKKVDSLIAKNATPEQALEIAQSAVRNLRKNMSGEWQSAVDVIKGKYTNKVALDANRLKQVTNIAEKFGDDILNKVDETGNITRINPKSMSVDDSLTLLKNINELYGKRIVRESAEGIPVRSFKDFFKKNIIDNFGGKDGEIATLYKNYSTKSDILNAADDIVKAYDTNNPIKQSTALGRIKSLFRENKGAYLKAIKDLESEMGVDITSYITASELGKGLTASKVVTAGGAGIFSKKGIIDKVFEAVLFPLTTPKYARQLLKLSTQKAEPTMRQAMGVIEKQPSKTKTILESMFPQGGKESPAAVLNSAKNAGKTIIDTAKQKTLKGSINNPLSKKGSPTMGKTVVSKTASGRDYSKLISKTKNSTDVNISDLVSVKNTKQSSIDESIRRFGDVEKGKLSPRKPLTVVELSNGKKLIIDGNATHATMSKQGYSGNVPVEVKKFTDLSIKPTDDQIINAVKMHQQGSEFVKPFDKLIGKMSDELRIEQLHPGDTTQKLKSVEGIIKKLYQTKDKYVNDVVRDTVFAGELEVPKIVSWLKKNGAKDFDTEVRKGLKNRFENTDSGYRDANYQFTLNGQIHELQIMGKNMYQAKQDFGHYIYDIAEKDLKFIKDSGELTPAIEKAMNNMQKVSNEIYDNAYKLDTAGKTVSSIEKMITPVERQLISDAIDAFSSLKNFESVEKLKKIMHFDPLAPSSLNIEKATDIKSQMNIAQKIKQSPVVTETWNKIYSNADILKPAQLMELKDTKLKGVAIVHLTKNCERTSFLKMMKKEGMIPEGFPESSCYNGACYKDRTRYFRQFNPNAPKIADRNIAITTNENVDKFFANENNVKKMNDSMFVRMGESGDDSHAIFNGTFKHFLEKAKEAGMRRKVVAVTSAYAPTTQEMYNSLKPFKDSFVLHVTESGWFSRGEIINRLNEFYKAKRAGLNVKMRVITNRSDISYAGKKADVAKVGGMKTPEETFLFDIIKKGKLQPLVLETPYHNDFLGKNARSMSTGEYKAVCCVTGKCATCGVKCLTQ